MMVSQVCREQAGCTALRGTQPTQWPLLRVSTSRCDGTCVAGSPAKGTFDTMYLGALFLLRNVCPVHFSVLGLILEGMMRSSFHGYCIFLLWACCVTLPSCPQPSLRAQSIAVFAEAFQGLNLHLINIELVLQKTKFSRKFNIFSP